MDTDSTILAIASSPGQGERNIIRMSGAATFELLTPLLGSGISTVDRGSGETVITRLHPGGIDLPCLAVLFPGPHSYTGEHAAELQIVGNPLLAGRLIDALLEEAHARGLEVRRAEAGEFTARAYLNGKMDLIEAEGVAATIVAQSDAELRAAKMLSSGELSKWGRALADDLADALALVEAGIDFTDQEDVVAISPSDLVRRLRDLADRISLQLRHSVGLEQLAEIPWVVLTGRPNAGKSALFNALLGRERAVVSKIRGTTRDVLTAPMTIDTWHGTAEVMLVDLAGADVQDSIIDREMQSAASEALRRAELILHCVPVGELKPDARGREIIVGTKLDLRKGHPPIGIAVSALRGTGLEDLRQLIASRLADRAVSLEADLMVMLARHESALRAGRTQLEEAIKLIESQTTQRQLSSPELAASILRTALNELEALTGSISPDDVLGRVFASFCVGK